MVSFNPHPYQNDAIAFILQKIFVEGQPGAGMFLDPGLGKTGISLSVCQALKDIGELGKVLIVGPKRVIHTVWRQEVAKFNFNLSVALVHGSPKQREKALASKADIYLVSSDGVVWLQDQTHDFDLAIIDESTAYKNWSSARTKAMRKIKRKRTVILTGTPASDNLIDIYPQVFLVDGGKSLGQNVTRFRYKYCYQGGYENREWFLRPNMEDQLYKDIAPVCLTMKAEDHLSMPELLTNDILIDLPQSAQRTYNEFEDEFFAEFDSGASLMALSSGAKYNILRQLASGNAYYTDEETLDRKVVNLHTEKIEAVKELAGELNGKPLIVGYRYNHELAELQKAFPKAGTINGETSGAKTVETIDDWVRGAVKILLCQHQAMSHGIDRLQKRGSDICWFTLPDSAEIYEQFNARLYRQGQEASQVRIHRIIARKTIDILVRSRLEKKITKQEELLEAIKNYRKEKQG